MNIADRVKSIRVRFLTWMREFSNALCNADWEDIGKRTGIALLGILFCLMGGIGLALLLGINTQEVLVFAKSVMKIGAIVAMAATFIFGLFVFIVAAFNL